MAGPSESDYSEAVQNPRTAFADADLKIGQVETNRLGLPVPRCGMYAVVFKVKSGQRSWAVRCFTREVSDQKIRYEKISQYINGIGLPYTVGFAYLGQGIRIRGKWLPILRMEWVEGESLKAYVARNLSNPAAILQLADRWVEMCRALHAANVAHGDLQHGNVLVVAGGNLKLVDYDGMFVPTLAGSRANEIGHPNYQHPKRGADDFGPFLDNFSSWIIYVSLRILALNPSLWHQLESEKHEGLIFRKEDFDDPDVSSVFRTMEFSTDASIQKANSLLRDFLAGEVTKVPALEEMIGDAFRPPEPIDGSWVNTHEKPKPTIPKDSQETVRPYGSTGIISTDGTWVQTHLPPLPRKHFGSFALERLIALLMLLGASIAAYASYRFYSLEYVVTAEATFIALTNPAIWYARYRRSAVFKEHREILKRHGPLMAEIAQRNDFLIKADQKKSEITADYETEVKKLEKQRVLIDQSEKQGVNSWQKGLQNEINRLTKQRADLQQAESRRIQAVTKSSRVNQISAQINSIKSDENTELSAAIRRNQQDYIESYLKRQRVEDAILTGIGAKMKSTLRAHGVFSAFDVDQYGAQRVPGIGPSKAQVLLGWRMMHAAYAQNTAPQNAAPHEINRISSKYLQKRNDLELERGREQKRLKSDEDSVRNECNLSRKQLDREEQLAREQVNRENDIVKKTFAEKRRNIGAARQKLDEAFRDNLAKVSKLEQIARKEHQRVSHRRATAERELEAFLEIRFSRFIIALIKFWKRAA